MRHGVNLFWSSLFWAMGTSVVAQESFITTTGEIVETLDQFQECNVCPEMVVLPMGEFQMGSTVEEANASKVRFMVSRNSIILPGYDLSTYEEELRQAFLYLGIDPNDPEEGLTQYYASGNIVREEDPQYFVNPSLHEVPIHTVSIDMPIAMGRNEITLEDWATCVEGGGCQQGQSDLLRAEYIECLAAGNCMETPATRLSFKHSIELFDADPRTPMIGITYSEAVSYASWLNDHVGVDVYRLPTEAEWEYAARSGTTTRYAQGDVLSLEQANFMVARLEIVDGEYNWNYDLGSTGELLPIDDLDAANAWGLRHMSGNVSEFTSTCGAGPHRGLASSSQYLTADVTRADCERAVKGGTYRSHVELARPARRFPASSDYWALSIGFRLVRDMRPRD